MHTETVEGYITDESRFTGKASRVVMAQSERDIVDLLQEAAAEKVVVTPQGGLTGITGAGVPQDGIALNMRNMRKIKALREEAGGFLMDVEPGCTLDGLRQLLLHPEKIDTQGWSENSLVAWRSLCSKPVHMFAPDLTEAGATIGGVVSTNGSGARSYFYGAARNHIEALRVVLVGGHILSIARGQQRANGLDFVLGTESGETYAGKLPSYQMPAVKHAAGLFAKPDMDLIDLFIGSEGILGVVSEITIRLIPRLEQVCGLTVFLRDEESALMLVDRVRSCGHNIQAIEFFSSQALNLLRQEHSCADGSGMQIPPLASHWHTAIYIEASTEDESVLEDLLDILISVGASEEDTWLAEGYQEIQTLKGIRHAIPERINRWIADQKKRWPDVTKLGTDLAVPDAALREVMAMYHLDLQAAGLQYVIFGHIGNNHLHVNILPENHDAWLRGKALYMKWAENVVAMGGTVSAEHGIGKLKVEMLKLMFGEKGIDEMRAVKQVFDAEFLLNRGTLF